MRRKFGPVLVTTLALFASLSFASEVNASDDQSRDHGSRATRDAKNGKKKKKKGPTNSLIYRFGLFGGAYVQGPTPGVMGDAMLGWELGVGDHTLTVSSDYLYEPFSTKTFNFPEEDQAVAPVDKRLVQGNHVVGGDLKWKTKWNKWLRSSLRFSADGWFPDYRRDRRWSTRLYPNLRFGKLKGVFGELDGQLFYKKFPNYRLADRSIDQQGFVAGASIGYNFDKLARLTAGFNYEFTDYLDARYDALDANGAVVRSTQSKDYLVYTPWAEARLRPGFGLDFSAKYEYEVQRTHNYDRNMTGRAPTGLPEQKLIDDYYAFKRTRLSWSASWEYKDRLSLEVMSELWIRRFDNYEARDAENFWTGELRIDASVEVGGEFAVRVVDFDWLKMENSLHFIVFASHLRRRSNMLREVSLATNFDVTRVFAGFELSSK